MAEEREGREGVGEADVVGEARVVVVGEASVVGEARVDDGEAVGVEARVRVEAGVFGVEAAAGGDWGDEGFLLEEPFLS